MRVNGPTPTAGHTASIHNGVPRRTLLSPPADRLRDHVGRDRLGRMGYGLQFAEGTRGGRHPPGSAVHLDLGLHLDLGSPSTTFAAAPRSTFQQDTRMYLCLLGRRTAAWRRPRNAPFALHAMRRGERESAHWEFEAGGEGRKQHVREGCALSPAGLAGEPDPTADDSSEQWGSRLARGPWCRRGAVRTPGRQDTEARQVGGQHGVE